MIETIAIFSLFGLILFFWSKAEETRNEKEDVRRQQEKKARYRAEGEAYDRGIAAGRKEAEEEAYVSAEDRIFAEHYKKEDLQNIIKNRQEPRE